MQDAGGSGEQGGAQPVSGRAEEGERQRAARDRQHPIAGAMQQHEGDRRSGADQGQQTGAERMQPGRKARAEIIGEARRNKLNSPTRAATRAGPTNAPATAAAAGITPRASSSPGKCAASAIETNQVAPNTAASTIMVLGTPPGAD